MPFQNRVKGMNIKDRGTASTVKYIIEMGQLDEKCDIGDSLVVQRLGRWAFIAEATVQSLDGELSALLD